MMQDMIEQPQWKTKPPVPWPEIPHIHIILMLTINDILLNCVDFMALHQQFYTANSMHELFTKEEQENILAFLSAAGLFHLI